MLLSNWRKHLTACLCVLLSGALYAQELAVTDVLKAFQDIPTKPKVYKFTNRFVPPPGGHLQGIQGYSVNGKEYALITVSSATYSYYLLVNLTDSNKVLSLNKIADSPLRHAGGCQLTDGKILVGIEDNYERNKSEIVCMELSDTLPEVEERSTIIIRQGKRDRHTAGATGFIKQNDSTYIAAVGDWDSRNIDFYRSQGSTPFQFELFATYSIDSVHTFTEFQSLATLSYQSINLLTDSSGQLFMVGFAKQGNRNRADLIRVRFIGNKVAFFPAGIQYYKCTPGVSFRYGAGIRVKNGKLQVYACQRNLNAVNVVNVFGE